MTPADRTETLVSDARRELDRMDMTLTLAEAKEVLARRLRARRQEREAACETPTCGCRA